MSKKDALAFLNLLSRDSKLKKRLEEGRSEELLIKTAKDMGYEFTLDEIKEVVEEIKGEEEELPEDILDMVVGGLSIEDIMSWIEKHYFNL